MERDSKFSAGKHESPAANLNLFYAVLYAPLKLLSAIISGSVSALRPFAYQIIPILVCAFFIPLIIFLSVLAGWTVWTNLSVGWEVPLYLQYGDGVAPYAHQHLPRLVSQQRYDIFIHLAVPAIESNLALGNFMTGLTLSTPSNKTLAYLRRPAMVITPTSSFFFKKPDLVHLQVPMLASFVPGTSKVIASVEIGRRDGWTSIGNGQGRELSVSYASVRGTAIPHGIRGLAIRFPFTFSLISAATFLLILSLMLATCILPTMLQYRVVRTEDEEDAQEMDKKLMKPDPLPVKQYPSSDSDEKKRRRRSRLSRSLSDRTRVKSETPTIAIPSAGTSSERLRRRTSRRFDDDSDSA